MTDKLTNVNAINAPKLMTEAINSRSGPIANNETTPVKTTVNTGVLN